MITHVTMEDAGEYSCRVDFRDSPTVVTRMRLTIVEEPRKPVILVSQRVGGDLFLAAQASRGLRMEWLKKRKFAVLQ